MQNLSAQKKKNVQLTRREIRHSCEGSPILCGRLFRDIRTFGRAVEGSNVSPLRNTMGGLSGCRRVGCGTCCPPFVMRKAYTIEGSSTPRRKSPAMCRLYCSTRCAKRSTSLASVLGASMLLARGCLLGRGRTSSPLSSAAFSAPSRGRVTGSRQNTIRAFLALDFLALLRSTVPYMRRKLLWCALHHVALPVRLQHRHVFWCQPPRRCQTAQERHPHMHVRGPSCSWASARSASVLFLIAPADSW